MKTVRYLCACAMLMYTTPEVCLAFNGNEGDKPQRVLKGHSSKILVLKYTRANDELLSGDAKGLLNVWGRSAETSDRSYNGHDAAILDVDMSGDSSELAVGFSDGAVLLVDFRTMRVNRVLRSELMGCVPVTSIKFLRMDRNALLVTYWNGRVLLWDSHNGNLINEFYTELRPLRTALLSNDDSVLATFGVLSVRDIQTPTIRTWDIKRQMVLAQIEGVEMDSPAYGGNVFSFCDDAALLLGRSAAVSVENMVFRKVPGTIAIWDYRNARRIDRIGVSTAFIAAISTDMMHGLIAVGDAAGCVFLVDLKTRSVTRRITAHRSRINAVAISLQDDDLATSGGVDGEIAIWHMKEK